MRLQGEITSAEFLQRATARPDSAASQIPKTNKFNAVRTTTEHGTFDSKREASWVEKLMLLQREGVIGKVETDKRALRYALDVNGVRIGDYTADARFTCLKEWPLTTEKGVIVLKPLKAYLCDAKSKGTRKARDWPLRRNLMFAIHDIKILEL